jgi:PAS domain S-box-containing protein
VEPGAAQVEDVALYRRAKLVTGLARAAGLALVVIAVAALWDDPATRRVPVLSVVAVYAAFAAIAQIRHRNAPRSRAWNVAHDVVDAVAVGAAAAWSGALASPVWLMLYPHAAAVAARGGLRYGLALGSLDAVIVLGLAALAPAAPQGALHAAAILACAAMAGAAAAHLGRVHDRLGQANRDLASRNRQLADALRAQEAARHEQDLALAQIRGAEKRYRRLLERVQDAVLVIQDGRLAYANPALASMMGEPPSVLVGLDVQSLVPASYRRELWEQYRRWEAGQVSEAFETRLSTRKGEAVLVSVRAAAMDLDGTRAVVATLRDIGRERRLEREIKDRAGSLSAVNEIANAGQPGPQHRGHLRGGGGGGAPPGRVRPALDRALDAEGGVEVVAVGAGTHRRRGPFTEDAVAWAFGRPFAWCQTGPEPRPPHAETLAEDGAGSVLALPLRAKDRLVGSLILGRLAAEPFGPNDFAVLEPVARHVAIAIDNARLLEDVRRRSREFESLLEIGSHIVERHALADLLPLVTRRVNRVMGTDHCVLRLRSGGTLMVAAHEGLEPAAGEAVDFPAKEELTSRVIGEGRAVVSHDRLPSFLGVPLRRGADILGALEVMSRDAGRRFGPEDEHVLSAFADQAAVAIENARLFEDAQSHLAGVVEANRRLEELDRLRQAYLRNVSHEFRTPLTVIKGYAEFLMETGSPGPEGLKDVMRILVESCDRVIDLVDTLLEVSRVEQEEAERILEVQTLDLKELAAASLEPVRPAAERKGVALDLEFTRTAWRWRATAACSGRWCASSSTTP